MANESESHRDPRPVPTPEELEQLLGRLVKLGLRRAEPDDLPELFALRCVQARRGYASERTALTAVIADLCNTIDDPILQKFAPFAFGHGLSEALTIGQRIKAAGVALNVPPNTLRRGPREALISEVAERLYNLEDRHRPEGWEIQAEAIRRSYERDVMRRFDFYFQMAFWLIGVAEDLRAVSACRIDGAEPDAQQFAASALWRWTNFDRVCNRFLASDFNGNWHFSEAEREVEIADLVLDLDQRASAIVLPVDRSELRVLAAMSLFGELAPFVKLVQGQDSTSRSLAAWTTWCFTCSCPDADEPSPSCELHEFATMAERFAEVVNDDYPNNFKAGGQPRHPTLLDHLA
jgi:hypothetical protein